MIREHPLFQLTLARLREFYREPEAIFWVFGFPIVLAFALGIAFRNRGPGELNVGVLRFPGDSAIVATLAATPGLRATVLDSAEARQRLRTGREGWISVLKRRDGLGRCRYRGRRGMERWVGWGVVSNNLWVLITRPGK